MRLLRERGRHLRILFSVVVVLVAGVASAQMKDQPPSDGTSDPDQGLGNDLGAKGSQNDLGASGDASDSCAAPDPQFGSGGEGTLRPPSDRSDNYALAAAAGETYTILLTVLEGDIGAHLTVWSPGCAELVAEGAPSERGGEVATFAAGQTGEYTVRVESVGGDEPPRGPPGRDCHTEDCFVITSGHCYPTCRGSYVLEAAAVD